jgi:hypothetical protein
VRHHVLVPGHRGVERRERLRLQGDAQRRVQHDHAVRLERVGAEPVGVELDHVADPVDGRVDLVDRAGVDGVADGQATRPRGLLELQVGDHDLHEVAGHGMG